MVPSPVLIGSVGGVVGSAGGGALVAAGGVLSAPGGATDGPGAVTTGVLVAEPMVPADVVSLFFNFTAAPPIFFPSSPNTSPESCTCWRRPVQKLSNTAPRCASPNVAAVTGCDTDAT